MALLSILETVIASMENVKSAKTGLINLFFGNASSQTFGTETINVDTYDGKRGEAGYTARGATGQTIGIEGWDTIQVTPPMIDEGYTLTANDLKIREYGQGNVNVENRQQAKFQKIVDRQEKRRQNRKTRAYTKQVLQLITTGKVTIVELDDKGKAKASREIDFKMPATSIYTVPVAWNNSGADIFGDMEKNDSKVNFASGLKPDFALVGTTTIQDMIANEKIQKLMDNRRINFGDMAKVEKGNGLVSWGIIGGKEIYTFEEFNDDGSQIIPVNAYISGSSQAETDILHGSIDMIVDGEPRVVETEEAFTTKVDEDAVNKKFIFKSARLYALTQAGAFSHMTTR